MTRQPVVFAAGGEPAVVISPVRYDAVVFDMDGVITDTARTHAAAWKRMFDAFLAERPAATGGRQRPFTQEDYLRYVDGKHRDDGVESFLASRGITLPRGDPDDRPGTSTVWALANRKNDDFQHVLAEQGAQAFPSSVRLVELLKQQGTGTAIISASRNCQLILQAAGIGALFPVRVDGVETERLRLPGKPSPAVFLEAARRLGVSPHRSVVVEDAIAGVQAGRAGGFGLVIGVDRGHGRAALLAGGADLVVADLAEVGVGLREGDPAGCGRGDGGEQGVGP